MIDDMINGQRAVDVEALGVETAGATRARTGAEICMQRTGAKVLMVVLRSS